MKKTPIPHTQAYWVMEIETQKLDLDQMSVAHTHTERNKCEKNCGHIVMLTVLAD